MSDSYVQINEIDAVEDEVFIHEVPYMLNSKKTILVDTIIACSKIEELANEMADMNNDKKNYIYCLLFSNLITIIDAFVKIYTEPIILKDKCLIEKFSSVFGIKKKIIEEKKQAIKDFYNKKSFQSVCFQKKLFNDVFNVDIKIDERINHYVAIRDMIIHRNAINPEGFIYQIKRSLLLKALNVIEDYIQNIFSVLSEYEANTFAKSILNNEK